MWVSQSAVWEVVSRRNEACGPFTVEVVSFNRLSVDRDRSPCPHLSNTFAEKPSESWLYSRIGLDWKASLVLGWHYCFLRCPVEFLWLLGTDGFHGNCARLSHQRLETSFSHMLVFCRLVPITDLDSRLFSRSQRGSSRFETVAFPVVRSCRY